MSEDNRMVEAILHYQRNIERNLHDENKILHCINKLLKMPITVSHLKETGIGRTVNSLRKNPGEVGDTAKQLVSKWKDIVAAEPADNAEEKPPTPPPIQKSSNSKKHKSSSKVHEKHIESKSSHKEDKNNKGNDSSKSTKSKSDTHSSSSKRKRSDSDLEDSKKFIETRCDSDVDRKPDSDCNTSSSSKHKKNKHRSKSKEESESTKRSSSSQKEDTREHKKTSSEKVKLKHNNENNSSTSGTKEKNGKSVKFAKVKAKDEVSTDEEGICSTSGASFAEALGVSFIPDKITVTKKSHSSSPSTSRSKSKSTSSSSSHSKVKSSSKIVNSTIPPAPVAALKLDIVDKSDAHISSLLPEVSTNYQPLGHYHLIDEQSSHKQKQLTEYEALSTSIMSRNQRTKVFSGNKTGWGKVPTLFDICVRVLQDNFHALEYTGGVPYYVLKPVLERANADQLFSLENHNPYLIEDTDELWRFHSQREFRAMKREELESWREFYLRCLDEREAKLRALTVNIKLAQDKSIPVRQTKLAYVDSAIKPPRNVARKQAKYGTASAGSNADKRPLVTPSSRLSTLAGPGAVGHVSVPNPGARSAASNSSAPSKPKKAPLMQKTIALMKNSTRYKR